MIAVRAAAATYEKQKEKNIDKFGDVKAAYEEHAAVVFDLYKLLMPTGFNVGVLCQETLKKKSPLTGDQIWESIWLPSNQMVTNHMIPTWHKLTGGKIPSGSQIDTLCDIHESFVMVNCCLPCQGWITFLSCTTQVAKLHRTSFPFDMDTIS